MASNKNSGRSKNDIANQPIKNINDDDDFD